jgi:hypothetical protein
MPRTLRPKAKAILLKAGAGRSTADRLVTTPCVLLGALSGGSGFGWQVTDHRLRARFANLLNKSGVPPSAPLKLVRSSKAETTTIDLGSCEKKMSGRLLNAL